MYGDQNENNQRENTEQKKMFETPEYFTQK